MKLSPLQLDHYHFTGISIVARDDISLNEVEGENSPYPKFGPDDIKTVVSLGEPEGESDAHQFVVVLSISCNPPDTSAFPYIFAVNVEGVFTIKHDGPLDERKKLVVCNGASMLFGAAREVLLSLSARQKYGPMLLPSGNFNGMGPDSLSSKKNSGSKDTAAKKISNS
jgi:preprotein translocase subunit SecB